MRYSDLNNRFVIITLRKGVKMARHILAREDRQKGFRNREGFEVE